MGKIKSVEEFFNEESAGIRRSFNMKISDRHIMVLLKSYGGNVRDATLDKCRYSCGVIKVNGSTMTIPPSVKPILVLEQSNFELLKHSEDLKIE